MKRLFVVIALVGLSSVAIGQNRAGPTGPDASEIPVSAKCRRRPGM